MTDAATLAINRKSLTRATVAVALSIVGVPLLALLIEALARGQGDAPSWSISPIAIAMLYSIVATLATLVLLAIRLTPSTARARDVVLRVSIVLLSWLAPIAIVVFLRLTVVQCAVLNLLLLPWPPGVKPAVQIVAALIILGSLAGLVLGFSRAPLRSAAVMMAIYSAVAVLPTFFILFLTIYGDPGPHCTPV